MKRALEVLVRGKVYVRDICLLSLLGLLILELLVEHHGRFWFERTYGFWSLFGVVGAFVLCKASKGLAHLFLSKGEGYYGEW